VSPRPPLLARLAQDGAFEEVELVAPPGTFGDTDRFADVAAVPGDDDAWVAVQPFADRRRSNVEARVARVDGATGAVEQFSLPASGAGRGSAAKVAFTGPNDGWLVTYAGWLFHWTDGSRPQREDDPAFDRLIDFRPNENAEQFIPDRPPVDDAATLAPPPLEVAIEPAADPGAVDEPEALPALLKRIRVRRRGLGIVVSFTVVRRARISLIALRGARRVKRSKPRVFRPGRRAIALRLTRRRWPTRLKLATKELDLPAAVDDGAAGDGDTVTTGPAR
jgi:hypothetical protein